MRCKKCKRFVSLLLIDFAHNECAYCTTQSCGVNDEKARELIKMMEDLAQLEKKEGGEV